MDRYKPLYLSKIMPAPDDPSHLQEFCQHDWNAFNTVYDICKSYSDKIKSISSVNIDTSKLSVKIQTDSETLKSIQETSNLDNTTINNTGIIEVLII